MRKRLPSPLQQRDFSLFWVAILATGFAAQMMAVAIGWQVYAIRENPLDLGLIGLAEFLPLPLLALPAGHIADRLPRRRVYAAAIVLEGLVAGGLIVVTMAGASSLWPFLLLALAAGSAAALGWPAARSMPPTLVSTDLLASAMALRGIAFQSATIIGPAIGGLIFATRAQLVYVVAAALFVVALCCILAVNERTEERLLEAAPSREALFAGARFVRRHAGAVRRYQPRPLRRALRRRDGPAARCFAKSILDTGPVGLGILRSAPAVGALAAGVLLAHRPIRGNAGRTLLVVVAIFGAAMIVFGLSKSFPLSCAALAVAGFADMFSMNIRSMTVALATPDALRGRVNAVEMVFISGSNELGAFESGIAAALIGAVPAVVLGGVATIVIAGLWWRFFPDLRRVDRLELLRPASEP